MPPKKKGAAAKAKAKAAAATTPRATRTAVPDSVTTKNGKEYETTAALSRPRRESTILPLPVEVKKKKAATVATPTKKRGRPTKASAEEEEPPKKRGRPAKKVAEEEENEDEEAPPKKRGRPAKTAEAVEENEDEDEEMEDAADEPIEAPKKRDRPAKKQATKAAAQAPTKRGRPSKAEIAAANADPEEELEENAEEEAPAPKKRGRQPKKMADAVPKDEKPPPKKRGSSPRGGETTKIDGDDDAAADQLEEELMDTDPPVVSKPAARGRPKGKGKGAKSKAAIGKGKAAAKGKAAMQDEEEAEADEEPEKTATGRQYWLMKAEQEDREEPLANGEVFNTKFTIDDLKSKGGPEPWDGVRNMEAAKYMRAMKLGDKAFFYASGGKSGRKPGIVGIMEVVKEHEPDTTAWDKGAYGYVAEEKKRDKWCVVHVEFRSKLSKPVHLSELQKYMDSNGVLSNMQVLKRSRLSVTSVTEREWDFITENLVEGYEEEDALPGAEGSLRNGTTNAEEDSTLVSNEQRLGGVELSMFGNAATGPVLPTIESEVPSTDTIFPAETSQTSRPASRGGSRAPSVKVNGTRRSSRASSVVGSLAAPTPNARGRSRTPKVRAGSAAPTNAAKEDVGSAMQTIGEDDE